MSKAPAEQFYWGDWLNDTGLQSASTVSRGVWINMLCRMWFAPVRGELSGTREELSKLCNANETEMITLENDIKRHRFADIVTDECNGIVTVRNRRMFRKGMEQKNTYLRVKRYREKKVCNANVTEPCNGVVTDASSSSINTPIVPKGDGYDEGFKIFWLNYPKKIGKWKAFQAWKRIKHPQEALEKMKAVLPRQKASEQWNKDNGQFIPNPATYLNQGRWEDETI